MAVFGHSGSQAPQFMHSLVIIVAIGDPFSSYRRAVRDAGCRAALVGRSGPRTAQFLTCSVVVVKLIGRCSAPAVLHGLLVAERADAVPDRPGERQGDERCNRDVEA